jgi:hypothetical protein
VGGVGACRKIRKISPIRGSYGTAAARVVDFEVDSVSSFLKAWLAATLLIVGYAWVDLRFNPHLAFETNFTLTPDVARLADLWDWGGRLLHHGAVGLLVLNAVALGGIAALLVRGALTVVRRLRTPLEPHHVSIVPGSVPTSVPPPAP